MAADGTLLLTYVTQNTSLGIQERGGPRWTKDGAHGSLTASVSQTSNEFVYWPFSGTAFGTRVDSNITAGGYYDINHAGTRVAMIDSSTPQEFRVYSYDGVTGTLGAVIATSPVELTAPEVIKWSPDDSYIAVTTSTPGLWVYPYTNDVIGTGIQSPSIGACFGCEWNAAGTKIAVARRTNGNHVAVFDFSGGVIGGMVEPSSAVTNDVVNVLFHPDGDWIACACDDTPFLYVYAWDGAAFGARTNPTPSNPGTGSGWYSAWSPLGNYIICAGIGGDENDAIWGYSFNKTDGTFSQTVYADIGISDLVVGLDVSPDAMYVATMDAAENVTIWLTGWSYPDEPEAPGALTLTVQSRSTCKPPIDVLARWTAPTSDFTITSYTATITGVSPTATPADSSHTTAGLFTTFGGLQPGGTYEVCVYATSSAGNGPTTCETITIT